MDQPSDNPIIQRVLNGDVDAFEALIDRYHAYVFAILGRRIPNEEVDDVAQLVFLKAYQSLANFKGKSEFRHWLAQIATRTCYDFWRKRYRSCEVICSQIGNEEHTWMQSIMDAQSVSDSEELCKKQEASEVLAYALSKLSPEDRMVLTLTHLEERSVKETALLLGWTQANVKVRAHRSRAKLKTILETALNGDSV
jgi:RNA polymerase sigma-70 factor (ECF subfamily)